MNNILIIFLALLWAVAADTIEVALPDSQAATRELKLVEYLDEETFEELCALYYDLGNELPVAVIDWLYDNGYVLEDYEDYCEQVAGESIMRDGLVDSRTRFAKNK